MMGTQVLVINPEGHGNVFVFIWVLATGMGRFPVHSHDKHEIQEVDENSTESWPD